jgi:hypothetical protein
MFMVIACISSSCQFVFLVLLLILQDSDKTSRVLGWPGLAEIGSCGCASSACSDYRKQHGGVRLHSPSSLQLVRIACWHCCRWRCGLAGSHITVVSFETLDMSKHRLCGLLVRVRFLALPDLLSSDESGTGSTQPREYSSVGIVSSRAKATEILLLLYLLLKIIWKLKHSKPITSSFTSKTNIIYFNYILCVLSTLRTDCVKDPMVMLEGKLHSLHHADYLQSQVLRLLRPSYFVMYNFSSLDSSTILFITSI